MGNERLWGEPEEFRGLKFYPFHLCDDEYYRLMLRLLSYSKNSIPDINILHISYLKFMLCAIGIQDIDKEICKLLSFVLKKTITTENNIRLRVKNQVISSFNDIEDITFLIDGQIYNESDFEKFREIILEQNGVSLKIINQFDPSLEKKLMFVQKGIEPIEFKEKIFRFCGYMKMLPQDVKKLTFYQFDQILEGLGLIEDYKLFKPLEASGQISFKDGSHIKHWLSHIPPRGRYDDIQMDVEKFKKENDFFKVSKEI